MPNYVQVSNNIWNWISSAVHLNSNNQAYLDLWRSGEKQPTFNQLEDFSQKTRIPFGYFFLSTPPTEKFKILEFRTVDSISLQNPSRDLMDTVRQMENVQEWMREYVIGSNGEKVSFVGSLPSNRDALSVAVAIRKILSLPVNWYENVKNVEDAFKHVRKAISNTGVLVMMNGIVGSNTHRALNVDEFRAFTLVDEYAPLIFINAADSRGGMLFSLFHEFAHIGIGTSSLFNASAGDSHFINPHETLCNAVTAELLVPIAVFRGKWEKADGEAIEKINSVSMSFKCSKTVIARRALDSGFISLNEYNQFISLVRIAVKNQQASSGGDYYKTQASRIDHKFLFALHASLHEGRTLHTEAFRLTNTNSSTFDGLINEARGERR
ncbi:MAG: ImmA/IrrE family metallo-endopeptidase [Oscillospiraceae bacterium]|jgi:Zn-dependent peptidase ImmA (M78 family)|nr:ImmA/IrrE family metallo-endopeptidase [Oscillospiraceae bacterium]